jgi:hypothetical protein
MPRFTLRTLFVVVTVIAVVLGWLMWQREIVRHRSDLLADVVRGGGEYVKIWTDTGIFVEPNGEIKFKAAAGPARMIFTKLSKEQQPQALGWWSPRSWFGDATIARIGLPPNSPADTMAKLRQWFPEASVDEKTN